MKTYFLDVLFHHYADFSGRATRKQFWLFILWDIIFGILLGIVSAIINIPLHIVEVLNLLWFLILIIPILAIFVRRVRDTGHSAYWGLLTVPWLLGNINKALQNVLEIQALSSIVNSIDVLLVLCFITILIFALLPSKK